MAGCGGRLLPRAGPGRPSARCRRPGQGRAHVGADLTALGCRSSGGHKNNICEPGAQGVPAAQDRGFQPCSEDTSMAWGTRTQGVGGAGSGDCQAMALTPALNERWALGKLFRPSASAAHSVKWGWGCWGDRRCPGGGVSRGWGALLTPQGEARGLLSVPGKSRGGPPTPWASPAGVNR